MKRYYIIYEGRVQGVGFRGRIMSLARKYDLTGYVKNLRNGKAVCEVQGEKTDEFLKESLEEYYYIRISNYSLKNIDIIEDETQFKLRF